MLFDALKPEISEEFRDVIESIAIYDEKIRFVLNKADRVDSLQLIRVYGALMWSLGKVFKRSETTRVYIGSFWNEPLQCDAHRRLFEIDEQEFFSVSLSLNFEYDVHRIYLLETPR